MIYLFALLITGALSATCPSLPSPVVDCSKYTGGECTGKGAGCVTNGWFSKDNVSNPNQRVNADYICKQQGYEKADPNYFGGNWGHQCRHPGNSKAVHNKAGGALTQLGYTVSWKCVGVRKCTVGGGQTQKPGTQKPGPSPTVCKATKALPSIVKDCGKYTKLPSPECNGRGAGCVGHGWFSKDNVSNPNQRVNAQQICRDQGYAEGADTVHFGGNWGHQCRHPGNSKTVTNKAGGSLTALGYTVTWKCKGNCQGSEPTPHPTVVPGSKCPVMPTRVVDCGVYLKKMGNTAECKTQNKLCRGEGWFSKDNTSNPNQRVNADLICKQQGFAKGASETHFGGNWGHQCRHPGNTANLVNKAGGLLTNLGYTVTWKCEGNPSERNCKDHFVPTPRPTPLVRKPCGPLPEKQVVDCGKYSLLSNAECKGKGAGCVGKGWFSKDNVVSGPEQRIDAVAICKQMGYSGVHTSMYGGNWGHQCRHPGNTVNVANKAGGVLTNFGYTVSWKCAGDSSCDKPVTPAPTIVPSGKGGPYPKDEEAVRKMCNKSSGEPGDKKQKKKCKKALKALGKLGKCSYNKKGECNLKKADKKKFFAKCEDLDNKKTCKKQGKPFDCAWAKKADECQYDG